jgi:hypothetical protein
MPPTAKVNAGFRWMTGKHLCWLSISHFDRTGHWATL